jgi:hypothetical protein
MTGASHTIAATGLAHEFRPDCWLTSVGSGQHRADASFSGRNGKPDKHVLWMSIHWRINRKLPLAAIAFFTTVRVMNVAMNE